MSQGPDTRLDDRAPEVVGGPSDSSSERGEPEIGALDELLGDRRLIVCVGPGGVGKTTAAAALGLRAARSGRRVLVLTIDPARRLADALGLDGLDDEEREVPLAGLRSGVRAPGGGPPETSGALFAAMLDTKASYDALIGRIASEEARGPILANRVYQAFSRTLARSHAYVAAERLYFVSRDPRFDLVILDTPPTRSALDILDAPGRLARFLDEGVVRAFLEPAGDAPGPLAQLAGAGSRAARRLLRVLAGESIVDELLGFFEVLADQREGFSQRAAATTELLRSPETAYVLIASAASTSLSDARHFAAELRRREAALRLVIFNRSFVPGATGQPLSPAPPASDVPPELAQVVERLGALRAKLVAAQAAAFRQARALRDELAPWAGAVALPERERDIQELSELAALLDVAYELDDPE